MKLKAKGKIALVFLGGFFLLAIARTLAQTAVHHSEALLVGFIGNLWRRCATPEGLFILLLCGGFMVCNVERRTYPTAVIETVPPQSRPLWRLIVNFLRGSFSIPEKTPPTPTPAP